MTFTAPTITRPRPPTPLAPSPDGAVSTVTTGPHGSITVSPTVSELSTPSGREETGRNMSVLCLIGLWSL